MTPDEFHRILKEAVDGSHEALEILLHLYEPLIRKHSMIDGELDEDLRQYIMIHIALNISAEHIKIPVMRFSAAFYEQRKIF